MADSTGKTPKATNLKQSYPRLFFAYQEKPGPSIAYPEGWSRLVDQLCRAIDSLLSDDQAKLLKIEQVKEKYGGLRFYYSVSGTLSTFNMDIRNADGGRARLKSKAEGTDSFPTAAVDKLIDEAEKRSEVTCCFCGAVGSERNDGWIYVACNACEAKRHPTQPKANP